jgi:hypothetical protein
VAFARGSQGWVLAAIAIAVVAVAVGAVLLLDDPSPSEPAIREPRGPFVPSGPTGSAVVWAVGDAAEGGGASRTVAAQIRAGRVDRFLYLGDVYGSEDNAAAYRDRYASLYGALAGRTAPTPGNHEWPRRADGYEPYWLMLTGRTPPAYYSFESAGWQILSLNSEAPHDPGSAQVRWLERELQTPGTCRLAFWHRPRFSAGRRGDQPHVAPLFDALKGHAALVVNAHDHNMQRFRPVGGITQVVSGAGGHGRYGVQPDARLAFGNGVDFGALRIDLRPGRARLRFVAADGRLLDDSTLRCRQPASA